VSDRRAAAPDEAAKAWMRDIEDRLARVESRRLQGALSAESLSAESLSISDSLTFPGTTEVLTAETVAAGNAPQIIRSTAGITLTTALQDVPGMAITVSRPGQYVYIFFVDVLFNTAGNATAFAQAAVTGGTSSGGQALLLDATLGPLMRATVGSLGLWNVPDASSRPALRIQALKNAATAAIDIVTSGSMMLVFRTGES
jgi:hypothetical protein